MTERINHPPHYGGDTTYEAIKVIEAWNLDFALGNAVKYICRAGKKADSKTIDDLRKARWYLDRAITRQEVALPSSSGTWWEEACRRRQELSRTSRSQRQAPEAVKAGDTVHLRFEIKIDSPDVGEPCTYDGRQCRRIGEFYDGGVHCSVVLDQGVPKIVETASLKLALTHGKQPTSVTVGPGPEVVAINEPARSPDDERTYPALQRVCTRFSPSAHPAFCANCGHTDEAHR